MTNNYQGGASTLTQQLIKNTVFNGGMETSSGARIERKIQEQYLGAPAHQKRGSENYYYELPEYD